MPDIALLSILGILFILWIIYAWLNSRKFVTKSLKTPADYLWKLRYITGKSEYEIFEIAAEEKGRPSHLVENDFYRYMKDQMLPIYVKQFLSDGKEHIDAFRGTKGNIFDKKLVVFYSALGFVMLGGALVICLWVFPKIWPIVPVRDNGNMVWYNNYEALPTAVEEYSLSPDSEFR